MSTKKKSTPALSIIFKEVRVDIINEAICFIPKENPPYIGFDVVEKMISELQALLQYKIE